MEANGYSQKQIQQYQSNNSKTTQHYCNVARMLLRGAKFENKLDEHINSVIESTPKPVNAIRIVDAHNQLIADIDDIIDTFSETYKQTTFEIGLDKYNRNQIQKAIVYYSDLLEQLKQVNTDEQLKDGYGHLNAKQLRNYIAFVQQIIEKLNDRPAKRVVVRKPQKKKLKTVKQQVSKLKYAQHSKKLGCTSLDPASIVVSSVLYVYNETFNQITCYQTANGEPLVINRSTIVNFDPTKSYTKRIRKAGPIVEKVLNEPRKRLEVTIKSINAKHTEPSGRITKKTVLLRTFK